MADERRLPSEQKHLLCACGADRSEEDPKVKTPGLEGALRVVTSGDAVLADVRACRLCGTLYLRR